MKLVINNCFGGFDIPDEYRSEFDYSWKIKRNDPKLIELVEKLISEGKNTFTCTCLVIVDVPDEATDYMISDYDGQESVIYVIDGKLHVL